MLLLCHNIVAMTSKLGHINVTMRSKQDHFTTFKVAKLHKNSVSVSISFQPSKNNNLPNIALQHESNVALTSKQLSIAA